MIAFFLWQDIVGQDFAFVIERTVMVLKGASVPRMGERRSLTMSLLLLIIVLVLVFGGLPRWGYHSYGYAPSGLGAVLLLILIVLLLSGRL